MCTNVEDSREDSVARRSYSKVEAWELLEAETLHY
jgi:hypothetical protein